MQIFHRRMKRLRYHSHCAPETDHQKISTGSSPGDGKKQKNHINDPTTTKINKSPLPVSLLNTTVLVRRANSCPEMKKGTSSTSSNKDNMSVTLDETDEDERDEQTVLENDAKVVLVNSETQTSNLWPMPYEHLFLDVFPFVEKETGEPKVSPAPSPAPFAQDKGNCFGSSVYDILDKFVAVCMVWFN